MARYSTVDDLKKFRNYVVKINIDDFYCVEISSVISSVSALDNNDDEIIEWIVKNIKGKWSDAGVGKYYFKIEHDAVACKLRWT